MSTPAESGPTDLGTLATLTAVASGSNSGDQLNERARGIAVGINVSAISGTSATLTVTIQGKDPASGTYYTLLASAGITATGFTRLTVYPGLTATTNAVASDVLPILWRVSWTITGTGPSVTGTIGAQLLN